MVDKVCSNCGFEFRSQSDYLQNTSRWRVCDNNHLWFNCKCHSTLFIKNGKYDWYSPDLAIPSKENRSIFNRLSMGDKLPHLPSAIMKIQQELDDENSCSRVLAKVAKNAPLIASLILKMANSLNPRTDSEIVSLEHAITYIGVNTLKELIQSAGIQSFRFRSIAFNSEQFWQESMMRGDIAEKLRYNLGIEVPKDKIYLSASLCNIGKAAIAICFPEDIDKIENEMQDPKKLSTWLEGEKRNSSFDHRILGEIAGAFWGLPDYVLQSVLEHHDVPLGNNTNYLVHVVSLANQLTHWINLKPHLIDNQQLEELKGIFKISDNDLDDFVLKYRSSDSVAV